MPSVCSSIRVAVGVNISLYGEAMLRVDLLLPLYLCVTSNFACKQSTPSFFASFGIVRERVLKPWKPFRRACILQSNRNNVSSDEIAALEKQVLSSAKSRIDMARVLKALEDDKCALSGRNDLMYEDEDLARSTTSPWQVASAAAVVMAGITFAAFQNYFFSIFISGLVFVTATFDDDSLSGALARILGRSTIRSVKATQPKVKALARVVVTGEEEIASLKARIERLEGENKYLLLWKEQRIKVDESLPRYTIRELKDVARLHALAVGGTKSELLFRLVEADVIRID